MRKSLLARLFAAAVSVATMLAMPTAFAQDAQKVAGTTVTMTPPEGFSPADGFAGFVNQETEASILIAELPAEAYAQLRPLFEDQNLAATAFASQGVVVSALAKVATDAGEEIPLLSGTQSAGGVTFDKWIALLHGDKTVMVTVQAPQETGMAQETVEAMMRSVSLGAPATVEEKIAALPFSISPVEPFRVVDTIAGSGVLMTAGPLDVDPDGTQPLLITVMQVSQPIDRSQQAEVAEMLLLQTNGLAAAEIEVRESVQFAGTEGVLLSGTAQEDGRERRFVQYFSVGADGRFVRLIATADKDAFETVEEAVAATAATVSFRN